jgi:hypothetical protein
LIRKQHWRLDRIVGWRLVKRRWRVGRGWCRAVLVDVTNADGTVTTWGFEAEGPSTLTRAGIRRSDFAPGTKLTITGHPMKDGRSAAAWMRATLHQ